MSINKSLIKQLVSQQLPNASSRDIDKAMKSVLKKQKHKSFEDVVDYIIDELEKQEEKVKTKQLSLVRDWSRSW